MQQATCRGSQERADIEASPAMGEALPVLFARLRGRFGGVLYRHHIPVDDGEDLVQTTLLLAVAKWNDIRNPEAWLIGTLHKRCILYWRARNTHTEVTRTFEELDSEHGVEPDQARRERFADLGKVWHCLPPVQRKLLLLRFQEGMKPREAAQAVGLACSSVRKTTSRACERLRKALGAAPPRTPFRRRPPRQPAAAPALAKGLRAEGASAEWRAAVEAFLATSPVSAHTRRQYRYHLFRAGAAAEWPALAEVSESDLLALRAAILADGRAPGTHFCEFVVVRCFLLWVGEQGWIAVDRDVIRVVLRSWDPRRQRSPRADGAGGR